MRGHVHKRGSTWSVVVYLGKNASTGRKGQHTKGGFPTRAEAEVYAHEVIHALAHGETWPAARCTTGQWLRSWIESRRAGWSGLTVLRREQILRGYLLPALDAIPLTALTPQHIQAVYAAAQRAGRAPNTIRAIHVMVATACKDALRQGLLRRDVASLVHPPQYAPRPMAIWDEEQVDLFLGAAVKHSRWWMLYYLAIGTGLRLGELTSLHRMDVDWELQLLMVTKTQEKLPGQAVRFKPTKTHRSRRPVVLMPELLLPLRAWIAALPPTQQILFSARPGLPLREETVREDFYRVIDLAKLPRIRPHDLRHTHTSLLAHFKVPIKAIQERLGHSNPSTTLRMYAHILPSWNQETYRAFGRRFFGRARRIPTSKEVEHVERKRARHDTEHPPARGEIPGRGPDRF